MSRDGKRRSEAQETGVTGERVFAAWAPSVGMTANKSEEDLGIDFFCQLVDDAKYVTGELLSVQVRSTAALARKQVLLDRDDAAVAIALDGPYCLVGVDVRANEIRFRFLDDGLFAELTSFLQSDRKTWSVSFRKLDAGTTRFRAELARTTSPGFQHRLRLLKQQHAMRAELPGATLGVNVSERGAAPVVELPWLSSAFEVDLARRGEVLERILVRGEAPSPTIEGLRPRAALRHAYRLGDGSGIFVTGRTEIDADLVLIDDEGALQVPAVIRHLDDTFAWVTSSGLVVLLGSLVSTEDGEQHPVTFSITRARAQPLGDSADDLLFLRRLRPTARLSLGDEWDVELWDPLSRIGDTITALELVCEKAGLPLTSFFLADLDDPEFRLSLMVLDGVARGAQLQDVIGQVLVGPAAVRGVEPHHPGWYEVPLVANLREHAVVVWLRGRCLYSRVDGQICGIRVLAQVSPRWEVRPRQPTARRPEIWIATSWPAFDFIDGWGPLRKIEPANHPIAGRCWLDKTPSHGPAMPPKEWIADASAEIRALFEEARGSSAPTT